MNLHKLVTHLLTVGLSKTKVANLLEVDNRTISNIASNEDYRCVKIPKQTMKAGIQ